MLLNRCILKTHHQRPTYTIPNNVYIACRCFRAVFPKVCIEIILLCTEILMNGENILKISIYSILSSKAVFQQFFKTF